jgi:stage V sporulation protein K
VRPRGGNGEFTPPLVRLSFGTEGLIDLAEFGHPPPPVEASPTRLPALPSAQAAAHPATAGAAEARPRPMDEIWRELDSLIGLTSVKTLVREISAYVDIQRRRAREQLAADPLVLHMFFKGNPGTGKTTVARLLGRLFKEMSVLQKGHLVETERADLVGEYIGHTAQKTRDQLKKAMGGILFVDEAHALARGGEKDFGKEAIDTMVKAMEDHKDNLVVILAGYRREMEHFVRQNPGLKSRFPIRIDFPDFTLDELVAISRLMLQRRQYRLSAEGEAKLSDLLASKARQDENSGNARLVRNILERAIRRHATRLVNRPDASRDELMLLLPEDLQETTE